jgi:ribonucleoside-diphosphate reductase alpha chain
MTEYGPTLPISKEIHAMKYRGQGESFKEAMARVADALKDTEEHFLKFKDILYNMRFLPAGRVQAAMGAPRTVTPYNCFVSKTIDDSMDDIMDAAKEAATTMRLGGGIGYDFSTLRPRGDNIRSLNSRSSGPVSFMGIFDSVCRTISSAGHRRGAQMGVLRVDHPDILEFIKAKNNHDNLTNFNVSVGVTDEFMQKVYYDADFDLRFDGHVYETVRARALWDALLRSTWDWAEPGILFIDRINKKNNLWYCETIAATNPCGEQPLPPYGACLLGSFNLTKYVQHFIREDGSSHFEFNYEQLKHDIPYVVRAMDNVVDRATYPSQSKRRKQRVKDEWVLALLVLLMLLRHWGIRMRQTALWKFLNKS